MEMITRTLTPARRALAILAFLAFAASPPMQVAGETGIPDVTGTGWKSALGCIGCGVGAFGVVMGGPASIIAAVHFPGGGLIAAGCVAMCAEAIAD
jgi:hypothetical protein